MLPQTLFLLFHTMTCFYVIYKYVFCDITMVTHYDITMGNNIFRDSHCEITMGNIVGVAMCTYDITMHNDLTINLFYYVLL